MPPPAGAWNHNIHYYPVLLDAAPERCDRALDVGCGDGLLARALRRRTGRVVGIDLDAASVEGARRDHAAPGVEFVVGDVLTHAFEPASFDLVGRAQHKARRTHWESSAPTVWPPERSYGEIRALARRVLPGARFRHRLLWRYSITWTKPAA